VRRERPRLQGATSPGNVHECSIDTITGCSRHESHDVHSLIPPVIV
jgi:hypothetical protein